MRTTLGIISAERIYKARHLVVERKTFDLTHKYLWNSGESASLTPIVTLSAINIGIERMKLFLYLRGTSQTRRVRCTYSRIFAFWVVKRTANMLDRRPICLRQMKRNRVNQNSL